MLVDKLKSIVGPSGWTTDPARLEPHLTEWRGLYRGATPLMVSPDSTGQVARIVSACAASGTAVVPQGGNTGLCGGAIPDGSGTQILLSLSRMNRIRALLADDFSVIVEAGCVLADLQAAADDADRFFPLSLAAEGSCQVGGNLSTDAGGINVLKYGTARAQVLGLEVVLADGTVWDGLRALRKDTAGYDLKHLFLGAEGTLGVITAANLRLYPKATRLTTAMLAVASPRGSVELLAELRVTMGDQLQAFELISDVALRYVLEHIPGTRSPFDADYPWYVLLESSLDAGVEDIEERLTPVMERGLALDGVVAKSETERADLWQIRHSISEAQKFEGASLKHDVSVPISRIGEFIEATQAAVNEAMPGARVVAFGHVGDGNVHFNVSQPESWTPERFREHESELDAIIYERVAALDGSISAEHGIGRLKRDQLRRYRSDTELALMRAVKKALDPANIMNPGKVI